MRAQHISWGQVFTLCSETLHFHSTTSAVRIPHPCPFPVAPPYHILTPSFKFQVFISILVCFIVPQTGILHLRMVYIFYRMLTSSRMFREPLVFLLNFLHPYPTHHLQLTMFSWVIAHYLVVHFTLMGQREPLGPGGLLGHRLIAA